MRSRKPRCSPGQSSSSPRCCRSRKRFNHCDRPSTALQLPRPGTPPVGPASPTSSVVRGGSQPPAAHIHSFFRARHVLRCLPIRPCPSIASAGRPALGVLGREGYKESDGERGLAFRHPPYSCDGGGRHDGRDGSEVATSRSKQVARSSAFHTLLSFRFFPNEKEEEETVLGPPRSGNAVDMKWR